MVDRVATLAWLAQEAAIELHPWTSRTSAPDRPTYALIDIDPGTKTTFEEVLVLARLYPDRARAPGRHRPAEGHRQARHPGLGPDQADLHLRADAGLGRGALAGGRPDWCRSWSAGSGRSATARAGHGSTSPRTRSTGRWSAPTGAAGGGSAGVSARSAGRSWTTPSWRPTAGRSSTLPERLDGGGGPVRAGADAGAGAAGPLRRMKKPRAGSPTLGVTGPGAARGDRSPECE